MPRKSAIPFLVLIAVPLLPAPTTAQDSPWSAPEVLGLADSVLEVATGSNGENIGVLYRAAASSKTGFFLRTPDGAWSQKTADISGTLAPGLDVEALIGIGGTKWLAMAGTKIWKSTDDGATWTVKLTDTTYPSQTLAWNGANAVIHAFVGPGARAYMRQSLDLGETWQSAMEVSDNKGAPGSAGTAAFTGVSFIDAKARNTNTWDISFNNNAASNSGNSNGVATVACYLDGFCTVPYEAEAGSTQTFIAATFPSCANGYSNAFAGQSHLFWWCGSGGQVQAMTSLMSGNPTTVAIPNNCGAGTPYVPFSLGQASDANAAGKALVAYTCSGGTLGLNVYLGTTTWTLTETLPGLIVGSAYGITLTPSRGFVVYEDTSVGGQLKAIWAEIPSVVDVPSYEEVEVTNLSGFDVDPYRGVVVARHEIGPEAEIRTYDASTLQELASEETPWCNYAWIPAGVMVYQKKEGVPFVAYLECNEDGDETEKLIIRSADLGDPDTSGTACQANDALCTFWLQSDEDTGNAGVGIDKCPGESAFAFPPHAGEIANVASMPISFEAGRNDGQGIDIGTSSNVLVGFAYHNQANGRIGVFADLQREDYADKSCGLEVQFTTPDAYVQICTWRHGDGDPTEYFQTAGQVSEIDYILGSSNQGGSRVWAVQIDPHQGAIIATAPEVTINVLKTLPAPYDRLEAIACHKDASLLMTLDGKVYRLDVTKAGATPLWGPVQGTPTSHGVAISADGKWYAYRDGANVKVGNALTGLVTGSVELPEGIFRDMRLDDTGQVLYVGTQTRLALYNLQGAGLTTDQPVAPGTRCDDEDPTDCFQLAPDGSVIDPDNPLGTPPAAPPDNGISDLMDPMVEGMEALFGAAGAWILGILLIVGLGAFGLYKWGKGIGVTLALLGLAMSVAMGFIPVWFLALFILFSAAGFVMKQRLWSLS